MLCRAKLDMLEEKNAEVEQIKARMERMQREYEERLHGTATELQRLQLEKTLLQVQLLYFFSFATAHRPCAGEPRVHRHVALSSNGQIWISKLPSWEHRARLMQEAGKQNILSFR